MMRIVVENLLLFLLPSLLYLAFRFVQRARSGDQDTSSQGHAVRRDINDAPFIWLFIAGAALVLATLIAFGSTSNSGKPGQTYFPPEVRDGQVIPGHFK